MNPGIYEISNEEYHVSQGVSRSAIGYFRKSPLHYWHRYLNPLYKPEKPTDAMIFGQALHTWVLEPQTKWNRYYVAGNHDRRTKKGKEAYDADRMRAGDRILITHDMRQQLDEITNAVMKHSMAGKLVLGAEYEKSIYWVDKETQLLCKCRPDIWSSNYLADLKTSSDGSYNAFQRSIINFGYDIQAAMCREGIKHVTGQEIHDFVFVVIEKEPPYVIATYPLDKAWIDEGEFKFKEVLKEIKFCIARNQWPGYPVANMCLPGWAVQ